MTKLSDLEQTHLSSDPVGQEFRQGFARCAASGSHKPALKVLVGLGSHLKA